MRFHKHLSSRAYNNKVSGIVGHIDNPNETLLCIYVFQDTNVCVISSVCDLLMLPSMEGILLSCNWQFVYES